MTRRSSSPMIPASPACGFRPQTAIFGRRSPKSRTASQVSSMTSRTPRAVMSDGTCASGTWIVARLTRSGPPTSIIACRLAFVRAASISVCPGNGLPAARMASLLIGAVTIASTKPSRARWTAPATASIAARPPAALARPGGGMRSRSGPVSTSGQREPAALGSRRVDRREGDPAAERAGRGLHDGQAADDDRPAGAPEPRRGERLDDDLRPDAGRVAHRDREDRFHRRRSRPPPALRAQNLLEHREEPGQLLARDDERRREPQGLLLDGVDQVAALLGRERHRLSPAPRGRRR